MSFFTSFGNWREHGLSGLYELALGAALTLGSHSVLLGLSPHLQRCEKSQPGPYQMLNNDLSSFSHMYMHTQHVPLVGKSRENIYLQHKCVQSHGSRQHDGLCCLWRTWMLFAASPPPHGLPSRAGSWPSLDSGTWLSSPLVSARITILL